ncbi:MAG: radical SAM protein [Nitrospirota bacterium]
MRVLLVHPSVVNDTPQPPLGVAYVASYLHGICNHDVRLIDLGTQPPVHAVDTLRKKIKEFNPGIVGISFLTTQFEIAMKCFRMVKSVSNNIITVAGGVHTSSLPEEVLNQPAVDFAVFGEGEMTMAELTEAVNTNKTSFEGIKGLGFKKEGRIMLNSPREPIKDIDTIPLPFWKDLSKTKYTDLSFRYADKDSPHDEVRFFPVLTSRGCPNKCNFCAVNVVSSGKLRFRDPEKVFREIQWLYNDYGARYFQIIDDTATVKKGNMITLCRMIIDSGMDIKWGCKSRVNTVDPELLGYMKKAGCRLISFGVESGDQEILKKIGKNITLEQVKKAFTTTKQTGILTEAYFMVGNIGETWESVNRTISFIKELDADYVGCSITVPFPGTEIYRIIKEKGWLKNIDYSKFNAAFHFVGDPLPIMRTEAMSQRDLLNAYYKVNSSIVMKKMKLAYGNKFYLKPTYYKREIFFRIRSMGIRRFASVLYNLFVNRGLTGQRLMKFSRGAEK